MNKVQFDTVFKILDNQSIKMFDYMLATTYVSLAVGFLAGRGEDVFEKALKMNAAAFLEPVTNVAIEALSKGLHSTFNKEPKESSYFFTAMSSQLLTQYAVESLSLWGQGQGEDFLTLQRVAVSTIQVVLKELCLEEVYKSQLDLIY